MVKAQNVMNQIQRITFTIISRTGEIPLPKKKEAIRRKGDVEPEAAPAATVEAAPAGGEAEVVAEAADAGHPGHLETAALWGKACASPKEWVMTGYKPRAAAL